MSEASIATRLARPIGPVWPNPEQTLVLTAIFAPEPAALAAFQSWRSKINMADHFDHAVFRLLPLLYRRLAALGVQDPVMGKLKGVYRNAWSNTHSLLHATAPALGILQAQNIPTALLKGAPLVLLYYRNHGSRPMADMDIAIPTPQARLAIESLAAAGWLPDRPITAQDLRFRHALTLRGPDGQEMDLHWHMLFERCDTAADAIFWNHLQPLDCNGFPTATPSPELTLLHTIAHGLRANIEPPIRWIADALTILASTGPNFKWPLLTFSAEQLGVAKRLALGLHYLQDHHHAAIPDMVFNDLQAAPYLLAERLEIAVMLRPVAARSPKVFRKCLLILAEFLRLTHAQTWRATAATLPDFTAYRLGLKSWRQVLAGIKRRLKL